MKNLIKNVFTQTKFNLKELGFGDLYINQNEGKVSFWLVIESQKFDDVLTNQNKWFNECKKNVAKKDFDKNISLLILHKMQEGKEMLSYKNDILKIEEDPFQFKKQVLVYSDSEESNLKKQLEVNNIESLLVDKDVFSQYKKEYSNSWQSLLYRIAVKLPMINIDIGDNNQLESLFADNLKKIKDRNYEKKDNLIHELSLTEGTDDEVFDFLISKINKDDKN